MKTMAVVVPSLYVSGGELFTYYMIKNTDHKMIEWKIVIVEESYADKKLLEKYSFFCPVWFSNNIYYKGSCHSMSVDEALAVVEKCDGIVGWELDAKRAIIFNRCKGNKYYLIFRHDSQHKKWTRPDYTLVANSISCIEDFGDIKDRHVNIVPSCFSQEHLSVTIPRNEMRKNLGIKDDGIVVGFIGRMDNNKNPIALARVAATDDNLTICAFGERNWESSLIENIINEESHGRMQWHDPVIPIGNILNAIDVFVQTSYSEVFSLALLEAWAFGVPSVSTYTGMVPYLNEKYGKICEIIHPDDSPEAIIKAISKAIADKEMVGRAYKMAYSEFTETHFGEVWTSILLSQPTNGRL